jgi:hypothetical protein
MEKLTPDSQDKALALLPFSREWAIFNKLQPDLNRTV